MSTVLVSHDGPHNPDDWAMASANEIFNIDSIDGVRKLAAEKAKLGIAMTLEPFYDEVMQRERAYLDNDPNHCDKPHDTHALALKAVELIAKESKGNPWVDKLTSDEWKHHATVTLTHHMQSAQHVERLWHADNHPGNACATAYKAKYQGI